MRLSLISPLTTGLSPQEARDSEYGDAPLGVLTLASVARAHRHDVRVFDLDHLSRVLGVKSFLSDSADLICDTDSEVYGLGTICSSYPLALRLAREIHRRKPSSRIVLGGPQASVTDVDVVKAVREIDYVVRGEAENIFPALLSAIQSGSVPTGVPGITYRNGDRIYRTPDAQVILDLDVIPDPAWDLDVLFLQRPEPSVEMGRGCPFACEFCSTNDFFRRKFRMKSPGRVLAQMIEMERQFGARQFALVHDMFTVDRRRVVAFCEEMENSGRNYRWSCSARTDCVDRELLEKMHQAGCTKVFFGVESGSQRLQKSMQKHLDVAEARSVVDYVETIEMRSTVSLIIGFPDETAEDLRDTADMFLFAARLPRAEKHIQLLGALARTPITIRHRDALTLDLTQDCWSGDLEDLEWIRRYPDLFINFYSLPTLLPRQHLRELQWFLKSGIFRCNWLLQTLHREGGNICSVFDRFYSPDKPRTPEWYRSPRFEEELLDFADALSVESHFVASGILSDYYRQLAHAKPAPAWIKNTEYAYSDEAIVLLPAGAVLIHAQGDVLAIIEALREGATLPAESSPTTVLVESLEDGSHMLTGIDCFQAQILSFCDGHRAIEIGARAKAAGLAPDALPDGTVAQILLDSLNASGWVRLVNAADPLYSFETIKTVVHGTQPPC